MALIIEETHESRPLHDSYEPNQKSIDLEFVCWDSDPTVIEIDPTVLRLAVIAKVQAAPYGDPLFGLRLQQVQLRPLTAYIYTASVHYGVFTPPVELAIKVGLSITGSTEDINTALSTTIHSATGETGPNFANAINVEHGKGPKGTKRITPHASLRITSWYDPANWDQTLIEEIEELIGFYNLYDWHGWSAGRLLLTSVECADYEIGSGELVPVTFHFLKGRPELVTKGSGISFTKTAWSYVWDYTEPYSDNDASRIGRKIIATYEQEIYGPADFALLGIGS